MERGVDAGPWRNASLQTFWEPLLDFYKVALRTRETDMETNRQPGGNGGRGVSVNPLCLDLAT